MSQLLPEPGTPERGWLDARAGAVRAVVERGRSGWGPWARQALYGDPVGSVLAEVPAGESTDGDWDRVKSREVRAHLGQVFTPPDLSSLLADTLRVEDVDGPVLDPACGAGSLLLAVCQRRVERGWTVADALAGVEGWDRDPVAAWLCRARLVEWALGRSEGEVPGPLRVRATDALDADLGAFAAVIGNPPYLEAKRMRKAEPGLRERLKARFPQLSGAFDLYLAFCWLALELVRPGGECALLVPNKVCQGRYATPFREALLGDDPPGLVGLVDLSRMSPRPFPGTGVYPVVLHLRAAPPPERIEARRIQRPEDLHRVPSRPVRRAGLRAVGGESPIFTPFEQTWPHLEPLFEGPRLGQIAELASTCSFHRRGLRERYVGSERPERFDHRYLGLHSRARRTEVAAFGVRWEGGWIRYDTDELRAIGNPLPRIETFARPKVIWCQHALRMQAVADPEGRWVTKDTYPVGWPVEGGSLWELLAILNSSVFTGLYNTVYQGIVVGGETYHYLPAFLRHVPVPESGAPDLLVAAELAEELNGALPVDGDLWRELDRRVAAAYGVSEEGRLAVHRVHLARVGAESPG